MRSLQNLTPFQIHRIEPIPLENRKKHTKINTHQTIQNFALEHETDQTSLISPTSDLVSFRYVSLPLPPPKKKKKTDFETVIWQSRWSDFHFQN